MNKDKTEKKIAAGCLFVVALFFLVLAVYQCNEERKGMNVKEEIRLSATPPPIVDTTMCTKRNAIGIVTPAADEDPDGDPYDNPDFDDLIPGEEYDEEFVDRSEGDRELYDEQE